MSDQPLKDMTDAALSRRNAVERVIELLPLSFQRELVPLFRRWESRRLKNDGDETLIFHELRRTLNQATREGALDRRAFLQIFGALTSAGLLSLIFPQSASAAGYYNLGAFWKKRTTGLAASGYPANSGSDPYWDYVVLLMNMDTASGIPTTVFADESNIGKTPTITGSPYINNSLSPYASGKGSASFSNSTSDYLSWTDSSFDVSSQNFTVECWFKTTDSSRRTLFGVYPSQNSQGWYVDINPWGSTIGAFLGDGSNTLTLGGTGNITTTVNNGSWHHVALVRNGGTIYLYVDGSQAGSSSISISLTSGTLSFYAANSSNGYYFNGSLADLRFYNGVAKYTANFTPHTSPIGLGTANDKYWGYCVLACPFENSLKDMSGKRITVSGTAALNSSAKKFGNSGALFQKANSSYLRISGSSSLVLDADFTIELWVYFNSVSSSGAFFSQSGYEFYWTSVSNMIRMWDGSYYNLTFVPSVSTWYHIALCRKSGTTRLFINGTLQATVTHTATLFTSSEDLFLGAYANGGPSEFIDAHIDSVRITKGYARYTSDFTPPTAAFPVGKDETVDPFWTNTVLAMLMDDLTDFTGRHSITNNNSVTSNTSTKRFGTASAGFNGSNQYLTLSDSTDFALGASDFTIEWWGYLNTINPTGMVWLSQWEPVASNVSLLSVSLCNYTGGVQMNVNASGTNYGYSSSLGFSTGCWNHYALTRCGGTVSFFFNGVLIGTANIGSASVNDSPNALFIGCRSDNTRYLDGFIDDLRITKGVARYTQNFTPPTRAFASTPTSTYTDYDPYFSNVVLLMHMDGTNGSTSFTDASASAKTISLTGSPSITTSISRIGSGSASLNGSGQYLTAADGADWNFGSADFTLETWVYCLDVSSNRGILDHRSGETVSGFSLLKEGSKITFVADSGDGSSWEVNIYSSTIAANRWYHVAVTRSGTTFRLFLDGQVASSASPSSFSIASPSTPLKIGNIGGSSTPFYGYLDDLRITKGVARYTAAFAPPKIAHPNSAGIVTSGLVALLDAGDAASYDGSSQTWKNIVLSPADHLTWSTSDKSAALTLSSGNLSASIGGNSNGGVRGQLSLSGLCYWEVAVTATSGTLGQFWIGIAKSSGTIDGPANSDGWMYSVDGQKYGGGSGYTAFGSSFTQSDIIGIAVNMNTGKVWFSKNGVWQNSGDPSAGSGEAFSSVSGTLMPYVRLDTYPGASIQVTARFQSTAWTYSAPSGFSQITGNQTAYDFYLGSGSGSDGADPTFVGVAGGRSANDYFSFDGGDYFALTGSNTSFLNSIHTSSAKFTLVGALYCPTSYSPNGDAIISTRTNGYDAGLTVQLNSSKTLGFYVSNGSGDVINVTSSRALSTGWNFFAVSFDNAGTRLFYINGIEESIAATYSSPSSASSSQMRIGITTDLNTGRALKAGAGLGFISLYNRALSKSELDQNFNALRSRFGI